MHLDCERRETCCNPTNARDAMQTLLAIKRFKEKNSSDRETV